MGDHFQPSNAGNALVGVAVALSVVQILFVAARFYTRYLQRVKFGVDDYIICIALAGSLAQAIIDIALVEVAGLGHHVDEFSHSPGKIVIIMKGFLALEILDFPLTVTPAKISLLLFYVRIFCVPRFRICAYLVGAFVLALGITVFFEAFFQCSPIPYIWDKSINGVCVNQPTFYRLVSLLNVLTGILILVLPMPLVWRLHVPRGQKMALTGVLLLGGLGTLASILRTVNYFVNMKVQLDDVTWFSVKQGILALVESAVIIIAACLVSIWPLITRVIPRSVLAALSCHNTRPRQHRSWLMGTVGTQPKSHDEVVRIDPIQTPSENGWNWDSPPSSLADLVDQRLWIFDEERPLPRREEVVVVDRSKV